MPHVIVKMYPGRSEEQKRELAKRIVEDVIAATNSKESSISVAIEEVAPEAWMDKVYGPDIEPSLERLYKKPGYGRSNA